MDNTITLISATTEGSQFAEMIVEFQDGIYKVVVLTGDGDPEIAYDGVSEGNAVLREQAAASGISHMALSRALLDIFQTGWDIHSKDGTYYGSYPGDSEEEAFLAMLRLTDKSESDETTGTTDDWDITPRSR